MKIDEDLRVSSDFGRRSRSFSWPRCDVHFSLSEVYDVEPEQVAEKVRVGSKCSFWCNLDRAGRPQAGVFRRF